MDKDLPKPVPKSVPKGCSIQRKYPFPIFREFASTSTAPPDDSKPDWKCFVGQLQSDCVLVSDSDSINMLYSMGFFGKGTLSKRAPACSLEEQNSKDDAVLRNLEDKEMPEPKRKKIHHEDSSNFKIDPDGAAKEDSAAVDTVPSLGDAEAESEKLQLTFEEAFFLSYGLGSLVITENGRPLDLIKSWKKFCELSSNNNFPMMYTVYHHFRAKGWVVRSGVNYGSDYVLYKDGPPFYHSTYSVIVKTVKEKDLEEIEKSGRLPMTWPLLSALNRVNSHVAKAVIFAFVVKPELMSNQILTTPLCVPRFKVQEILIKRWVPSAKRE